jgi:hypothetical protein
MMVVVELIYTFCNSLQHVQSIFCLQRLHQSLLSNCSQCRISLKFYIHGFTSWMSVASLTAATSWTNRLPKRKRLLTYPRQWSHKTSLPIIPLLFSYVAIARTAEGVLFLGWCLRPLPSNIRCLENRYLATGLDTVALYSLWGLQF